MLKFLQSKKGFTLVELMIVLVLLSLGAYAFINFFSVAMRSYNKSEERYIKQEAVKQVATLLQSGSASVCAAQTADIFDSIGVVPTGNAQDESYSYLFAEEVKDDEGELEGYIISVLNKGDVRSQATVLSEVPIYMTIKAYKDDVPGFEGSKKQIYSGVSVTLAALEDDHENPPIPDDMYYSLDIAYHFPNMATKEGTSATVNYLAYNPMTDSGERASANTYNDSGLVVTGGSVKTVDEKGVVLRVYCDSIISPDNTDAAIGVPSMCFIATASYGLDSGEVGQLCEFRDNTLKKSDIGKAFVKAYYKLSPPIADFIRDSEPLKAIVRTALKPLIIVAEYANNEKIRVEGIISLTAFMACGITVAAIAVKKDQNRKKSRIKN